MARSVQAGNDWRLMEERPLIADRSQPTTAYGNVNVESIGNKKKSRLSGRSVILITTGLERFAFYGIVSNFAALLHDWAMNWEIFMYLMFVFLKLPYLFSFLGGSLADTKWGRYNVYFGSLIIQCVGSLLLLLVVVINEQVDDNRVLQFLCLAPLLLVALGIAGSGGTAIPLGIDQYRDEGPENAVTFFPPYYFAWSLANAVFGVLSFVQINFEKAYVQPRLALTCAAYLIAVISLWHQRNRLHKFPPNPKAGVLRIVFKIAKRVWRTKPTRGKRLTWEDRARRSLEGSNSGLSNEDVENARRLGGVSLVLVSLTVYWSIRAQGNSQFMQQGELMKDPFNRTRSPMIPSLMFVASNNVFILTVIPVLYGYLIPKMTISDLRYNINNLRRIGLGIIIAIAGLLAALIVEICRHRTPEHHIYDQQLEENLTVSDMSIFYQIPQYTLLALAEVLVFISALEFAYFRSPLPMRGFSIGLVYSVMGLGGLFSFIISIIINVADIDNSLVYQMNTTTYGKIYYFYVIMISLMVFGLVMFTITARRFKERASHYEPLLQVNGRQ